MFHELSMLIIRELCPDFVGELQVLEVDLCTSFVVALLRRPAMGMPVAHLE
jgi:hypothetical protein